ncbi:bifunctional hydroxymethylpyrimidine kinase/phosphomethylpyrimidine kinase [Enterococcus sp. LJL120]
MIKKVLTVAGSDSTGGAGIQADLKTFQEYGTFGFSAITSVMTMDPDQNWSHEVTSFSPELVAKQLKSIFTGGQLAAMKTGLLGDVGTIEVVKDYLEKYQMPNVVIDPVIASKGTQDLFQSENVVAIKKNLLPLATITTPNLVEAAILAEMPPLENLAEMKIAAEKIYQLGPKNVIVKGGHRLGGEKSLDVFFDGRNFEILENPLFKTDFNHGAGCTFAAAITAGLAKELSVFEAVVLAKDFVAAAIQEGLEINQYLGHVWHGAYNQAQNRVTSKNNQPSIK